MQIWCKSNQWEEYDVGLTWNFLFQQRWRLLRNFLHMNWITSVKNLMTLAVKVKILTIHFKKGTSQSSEKTRSGFVLPLTEEWDQDYKWVFLRKINFLLFPPIIRPYVKSCWFTIEPNFGLLVALGCRDTTWRWSVQVLCKNNQWEENDTGLTWNSHFQGRHFFCTFFLIWWITSLINFMTFAIKVKLLTIHFMKGTS